MRVVVVGVGYVGLTTGAALAELGHTVVGLDINQTKVDRLSAGDMTFFEPGLDALVRANVDSGNLRFTTNYAEACAEAEVVFVTVDTPTGENWEIRMEAVTAVAKSLAQVVPDEAVIVLKSTVPPGSNDDFRREFSAAHRTNHVPVVVSNPEFLREGQAVLDTFHPDRMVLGSRDGAGTAVLQALTAPIIEGKLSSPRIPSAPAGRRIPVPLVETDPVTAELIKYAANAFLATKISFINEIANLSEELGADVSTVAQGIGLDPRIGPQFLRAGLGFGGSCFPKDTRALMFKAWTHGFQFTLLKSVIEVNEAQRYRFVDRIRRSYVEYRGLTLAILGLSFKPQTDDLRESPALDIMRELHRDGMVLRATDPAAMVGATAQFPYATYLADPVACITDSDGVVLCTEWPQFQALDWGALALKVRRPIIFDGRNCLDPSAMRAAGWTYYGVGRP